ncbi:MAG: AAA family ATPase [Dehalococcoidia bacterium]
MHITMVAFSGRIASGKSSFAGGLARALDWPCASFGDFLRHQAAQGFLESNRPSLQQLGEEWISLGIAPFCDAVLKYVNWTAGSSVVVDGVRHLAVAEYLKSLARGSLFLVFVDTEEHVRAERAGTRGENAAEWEQVEAHSTEAQWALLRSAADLRLDGTLAIDEAVARVREAIEPPRDS